ncbi:unnamed protein product [Leptidea sinapis]|uniref:RING-CH-type domain-containing protein n=1 Tax=Leptidea sinapis TaxID=189913 RepID=A0A5E4QN78_9NEOP|nr:unnamed protein product [Leptidea sinapis]
MEKAGQSRPDKDPSDEDTNQGRKNILDKPTHLQENAGPSNMVKLPGAVSPRNSTLHLHKTIISKSEHNICHKITPQDVADALKLTSFSFGDDHPKVHKNFQELKIPILETTTKDEAATFIELKRFMASCLKLHKTDQSDVNASNVLNIQTVQNPINTIQNEMVLNIPNTSIGKVTTDVKTTVDSKPKSQDNNKKKTSGSMSERSEFAVAQRDSLSSIGSNVCRICMTKGRERLISPCNCKGSLANVHLSCLERWLNQVGRNHCELCGFSYPAIRTPRYTVLQALRLWFGNPRNRNHLQSDCLIFWLLSTVTAGLLSVCIVGTQYFVLEGNKFGKIDGARKDEGMLRLLSGISHRITETAMDFFMVIVLCGYSITVYLLWKDHYVMWNRWRRANVNVRLLLSPDANPVPFVPRPRYNV